MYVRNVFVILCIIMEFDSTLMFAQRTKASPTPSKNVCMSKSGTPVWYYNSTYECTGNRLIKRPTAPTTTEKTDRAHTAPAIATTPTTVIPTSTDVDVFDIFKCGFVQHTGKSRGYECCGYGKYRPDFDTCCVQMRYTYKVHKGKRHKDHVCCGMDIHPRNSIKPCRHPALNDRLWKTKLKFMKKYKAKKFCSSDKHEYLMTVGTKDEQHNFEFYHANITKLNNSKIDGTEQVKIAIDKFSPNRTLTGKSFFIISDNIFKNDFYLGLKDDVMKLPNKKKTFIKRFKKIQKKCRKSRNHLPRRKRRHRTRS